MKGTEEDRDKFRDRVKDALGERTQKDLEEAMEVSSGTLTRVFGGRKNVDLELLQGLETHLGVDAAALVKGTDFAEILQEGGNADTADEALPPEPEPDVEEPEPEPVAEDPEFEEPVVDDEPEDVVEEPEPAPAPRPAPEPAPEPALARESSGSAAQAKRPPPSAAAAERAPSNGHAAPPPARSKPQVEDVKPRPGIGGRVLRFFASIFGG